MSLSPSQRQLRASIAAYSRWAKEDSKAGTQPARAAFEQRFVDEVDPERVLPESERNRRAQAALAAHMRRLALASSKARKAATP
jgi:hypothetical protein